MVKKRRRQKRSILNPMNALTSLKAILASILTMLIMIIPTALMYLAFSRGFLVVGWILRLVTVIGGLWVWGWLVDKLYRWR